MEKVYRVGQKYPLLKPGIVVFTNGCFDILHPGHAAYLMSARALGDKLVVGLNSDSSVRGLKGESRPINDFEFRAKMLSFYNFIDYIFEFNESTPIELITVVKPDVLVKGSDYPLNKVVGEEFVSSYGGKTVLIDYIEGYSTTSIINRILN